MSQVAATLIQLRDLPDDELRAALVNTRDELFRLHLGQHTNQVTSSALLRSKRRDIARILTVLRSRELGHETQAAKASDAEPETVIETPAKKSKSGKKAK
jgi:large subunit ribosomal protein L29